MQVNKFTLEQVKQLIHMQDVLNQRLDIRWKTARWYWNLAIKDELMELANHLGFKWWKGNYRQGVTDSNRVQCQLEVIDVMHFDISKLTSEAAKLSAEDILARYNKEVPKAIKPRAGYELVSINRLMDGKDAAFLIPILLELTGLTPSDVVEVYTKKWVLNKFRWANGYGSGNYDKMWLQADGSYLEDNQVLENYGPLVIFGADDLYEYLEIEHSNHLARVRQKIEDKQDEQDG